MRETRGFFSGNVYSRALFLIGVVVFFLLPTQINSLWVLVFPPFFGWTFSHTIFFWGWIYAAFPLHTA